MTFKNEIDNVLDGIKNKKIRLKITLENDDIIIFEKIRVRIVRQLMYIDITDIDYNFHFFIKYDNIKSILQLFVQNKIKIKVLYIKKKSD